MANQKIKVGDNVRYTGKTGHDLTHGDIYEVGAVYQSGVLGVIDDAIELNGILSNDYELIPNTPTPPADECKFNHNYGYNGEGQPVPDDWVVKVTWEYNGRLDRTVMPASNHTWDKDTLSFCIISKASRKFTDEHGVTWVEEKKDKPEGKDT